MTSERVRQERPYCPRVVWDGSDMDWVEPRRCRLYLRGVGWDYTAEWPFNEAHEKIINYYRPSRRYAIGLFIPCSYGKPYSQSYIHYMVRRAIADLLREGLVHEIILTNAGVVPRELDEMWPYSAYDWNPAQETPEVKQCYRIVLKERIIDYVKRFADYYEGFAAYLRWDSDSWQALQEAAKDLGIKVRNLAPHSVPEREVEEAGLGLGYDEDHDIILITPTALMSLRTGLMELLKRE
ncbi:MAG: DUF5591 domain-containing protein [Desulfurococcales archaeon]|nr:DUF5591 domain-containing protein [Desulfurococcales archaeon]